MVLVISQFIFVKMKWKAVLVIHELLSRSGHHLTEETVKDDRRMGMLKVTIVEYFTVKANSSEEAYRLHKQKSPAVENVSTRVTEKEFYD
jgi:hypothetical protein